MRIVRSSLLALGLAFVVAVPTSVVLGERDAEASVSIAVGFDSLVKDADTVCVVVAQETKSLWEDGRIVTYTRVKVEQGVAGDLGAGSEGWVRTLGGSVGKIGQLVDGEPNLAVGKPSLVFLRKFKQGTTWEVSARSQGQYPVLTDEATKLRKVIRATNVGVLLPPKVAPAVAPAGAVQTQNVATTAPPAVVSFRLASEVMHDKPLEDVTREIAATWKRLHPAPAK